MTSLGVPVAASISSSVQVDDWTFFGRANQAVTVIVNTGTATTSPPFQPYLNYAQVQLVDPNGNVLATASNVQAGADVSLPGVNLPADGVYHVQVQVPSANPSSTGNYILTTWDATNHTFATTMNQVSYGQIPSPFNTDEWTFSALAGQQVKFDLLNSENPFVQFDLAGPNGFIGFSGLSTSSDLVTLPVSGTYVLKAYSVQLATGAYAFRLDQTSQTNLTVGTTYQGMLVGSGQPQLFVLDVPAASPMFVQLTDAAASDHIELYAKFGTPPTRQVYGEAANGPARPEPSDPERRRRHLVRAGLRRVGAPPAASRLQANATPVRVTAVTPVQYGTNSLATLTLNGAGFTTATSVALVAANNTTTYPASTVSFDTFTQLTATVNLAGVPQGVYSVLVTNGSGGSDTLPAAFTVTAAGQANLRDPVDPAGRCRPPHLVNVLRRVFQHRHRRHARAAAAARIVGGGRPAAVHPRTSRSWSPGSGPRPSPRVIRTRSRSWPAARSRACWSRANRSPSRSITPACSSRGILSESQFKFDLRIFNTTDADTDAIGASIAISPLQPAGISNAAGTGRRSL